MKVFYFWYNKIVFLVYRNRDINLFMNENENQYLSLKTAAGLYGYTRDHLGLMIRQGKLKGIKLGSYYVTTNEWIADYLKDYADPGHPATAGKFSNKFLTRALVSGGNVKEVKNKIIKVDFPNKPGNDFFSEIQKELLPSLQELSMTREKTNDLSTAPAQHHATTDNPYIILPIRKMEESERENILRKIYDRARLENRRETV